jgi:hypothetical protein
MAFEGTGMLTNGIKNHFSFHARQPDEGKLPNVSEIITGSEHTLIIDSRNRKMNFHPNPSKYTIDFPESYKNVTSIELRGSVFPKTEYNVNSSNFIIPFNVQDKITNVQIVNTGFGYTDGVYNENVSESPLGGTQATVQITVSNNKISNVSITNQGTGYLRGSYGGRDENINGFYLNTNPTILLENIPKDTDTLDRYKSAQLEVEVGTLLLAKLNYGQYDFTVPNDYQPGLCREVTRAIQEAIDNAIINGFIVDAGGPTTGAGYFPYATAPGETGSCMLTTENENATPNNRVVIQRGNNGGLQSLFLELLWGSVEDSTVIRTSRKLLGYGSKMIRNLFTPTDQTSGEISTIGAWSSSPITANHDYDLLDFDTYFILNLGADYDRVESNNDTIEKAFATLVFDNNTPNNVWRSPPTTLQAAGTGDSDYTSLISKPGVSKPIKGFDFDVKKVSFLQPKAEIRKFEIEFTKPNGDYYDFHGRDHILIFSIACDDINSANRF